MLSYEDFHGLLVARLPVGAVLQNPLKGISKIIAYPDNDCVVYRRGKADIKASLRNLYDAYQRFHGRAVTSSELKEYSPEVFDSKKSGHSCNCSFLFLVLERIGAVDETKGAGVKGDPFWVTIAE